MSPCSWTMRQVKVGQPQKHGGKLPRCLVFFPCRLMGGKTRWMFFVCWKRWLDLMVPLKNMGKKTKQVWRCHMGEVVAPCVDMRSTVQHWKNSWNSFISGRLSGLEKYNIQMISIFLMLLTGNMFIQLKSSHRSLGKKDTKKLCLPKAPQNPPSEV